MFLQEIAHLAQIAQRFAIALVQRNGAVAHIAVVRSNRSTAAVGPIGAAGIRRSEATRSVLAALPLLTTGLALAALLPLLLSRLSGLLTRRLSLLSALLALL